jgi:hypothetical protein
MIAIALGTVFGGFSVRQMRNWRPRIHSNDA